MCYLLSVNVAVNPSHTFASSVLNLRVMELDWLKYVVLDTSPHSWVIRDSSQKPKPDVKNEEWRCFRVSEEASIKNLLYISVITMMINFLSVC